MPADVERGLLVYMVGRVAHLLRLRDGRRRSQDGMARRRRKVVRPPLVAEVGITPFDAVSERTPTELEMGGSMSTARIEAEGKRASTRRLIEPVPAAEVEQPQVRVIRLASNDVEHDPEPLLTTRQIPLLLSLQSDSQVVADAGCVRVTIAAY